MVGTVLLILSEGFDDMAFLANQVILEEAGNDVITVSSSGGAVKGLDSSVMTVKFQDAIQHDVQFDAIVLVGGNHLNDISGVSDLVTSAHENNHIIGAIGSGISLIHSILGDIPLSADKSIVHADKVLSILDPEDVETFAVTLASLI